MLNVVMQIEAAAPQQSQHIDVFHVWMCVQVALFSQHATHWKECMLGVQQKPSGGSQMVVLQWRLVVIRHSKFMLRPDQEVIVHTTMAYMETVDLNGAACLQCDCSDGQGAVSSTMHDCASTLAFKSIS